MGGPAAADGTGQHFRGGDRRSFHDQATQLGEAVKLRAETALVDITPADGGILQA